MDIQNKNTPLIEQRADPFIYKHSDGYYYFTASVPTYDRIELRRAKTIHGLKDAETHNVWHKHETGPMSQHIWAPEIHYLDGKWYIYFAASEVDDIWKLRPYVLECKGQDPLKDEWTELGQMQAARVTINHSLISHWMEPFLKIRASVFSAGQKKQVDSLRLPICT